MIGFPFPQTPLPILEEIGQLAFRRTSYQVANKQFQMAWKQDELLVLARAWEDTISASSIGGRVAKKKKTDRPSFYERFVALSDTPILRSEHAVALKKHHLKHSYAFIRAFLNKKSQDSVNWFLLTKTEQRTLMKEDGDKLQLMDELVYLALDQFLNSARTESDESETANESSDATESDGDDHERAKCKPENAKSTDGKEVNSPRRSTRLSGAKTKGSVKEKKPDVRRLSAKEDKQMKPKRRRVEMPKNRLPADVDVKGILDQKTKVLARFLEHRAEERTQQHGQICQEREADQAFWAEEAAKDRAFLIKIILKK